MIYFKGSKISSPTKSTKLTFMYVTWLNYLDEFVYNNLKPQDLGWIMIQREHLLQV